MSNRSPLHYSAGVKCPYCGIALEEGFVNGNSCGVWACPQCSYGRNRFVQDGFIPVMGVAWPVLSNYHMARNKD